jgi:TRAP-type C4-dicarboxylate transport system permease large subunit
VHGARHLLGGLTASSSADAAMLSKILGPEMVKANYSPAFAAVITSCAAIITALIPPSIGLIIYGYIADVSVGRLFIGGIIPGLLLAASLMIVTWIIARQRGYKPLRTEFAGMPELGRSFAMRCGRSRSRSSSSSASATASSRRPRPARSPCCTRSWSACSRTGACGSPTCRR